MIRRAIWWAVAAFIIPLALGWSLAWTLIAAIAAAVAGTL